MQVFEDAHIWLASLYDDVLVFHVFCVYTMNWLLKYQSFKSLSTHSYLYSLNFHYIIQVKISSAKKFASSFFLCSIQCGHASTMSLIMLFCTKVRKPASTTIQYFRTRSLKANATPPVQATTFCKYSNHFLSFPNRIFRCR